MCMCGCFCVFAAKQTRAKYINPNISQNETEIMLNFHIEKEHIPKKKKNKGVTKK